MIKKAFFLLVIIVAFSISCVSAEDLSEIDSNDFDDLANDINITPENQILNLNKDYQLTNPSQKHIVIDKSITIDGNNHTIDAPDVSRVFWVKSDNVCIRNINFINSKTSGLAGGVISWWGDNGTLENCNFTDNVASSAGGAVSWRGNNGIIKNCNFVNNTVITSDDDSLTDGDGYYPENPQVYTIGGTGGALNLRGNNISVDYCNFVGNSAELSGGAIRINHGDNVKISNSRFKSNRARNSGGAISWHANEILLTDSKFIDNDRQDLLLYSQDITIVNCDFKDESCIESYYGANYTNVRFGFLNSFDELSSLINDTPEGGILILDDDYNYINGSNKGILISKSITIDGRNHTLNGNHLSRMFNITADNVTIKNLNFVDGNAFGRYGGIAGGGAIYWSGANGVLENCNFINNTGSGIEDDPFDKEETYVDEDGRIWHIIRMRPMGAKINEGGAIVWNGTGGLVSYCTFINNVVGYPDSGGAICWRGSSGKICNSKFSQNSAWCGAAVCWIGDDGLITNSQFIDNGFFDGGIYWFGDSGCINNSILIGTGFIDVVRGDVKADYNFWGDSVDNPNQFEKPDFVNSWLLIKFTHNGEFVDEGDEITIRYEVANLFEDNRISKINNFNLFSGEINYIAEKTGFLDISFKDNKINIDIDTRERIISADLTVYYANKISYAVKVVDVNGSIAGKKVKFTINKKNYYTTTDKKGVATLKGKLKPGKYTVYVSYGTAKAKNTITVKNILISKNVAKKVNKPAKFNVKVLNSKGKAFANQWVKVKFKGTLYKIKTNKKGIATFWIPKNLKVGKYVIKLGYKGLVNTNKIVVKN